MLHAIIVENSEFSYWNGRDRDDFVRSLDVEGLA